MGLWVGIGFHGSENVLNNIMQDQKRYPAKKIKKFKIKAHSSFYRLDNPVCKRVTRAM